MVTPGWQRKVVNVVLVYLIGLDGKMHDRQLEAAQTQEQAFRQYVQENCFDVPGQPSRRGSKLADLRDRASLGDVEL